MPQRSAAHPALLSHGVGVKGNPARMGYLKFEEHSLLSNGFDSILDTDKGKAVQDGKKYTGFKTRYRTEELLE